MSFDNNTSDTPHEQPPLTHHALLVQDLEANCKRLVQEKIRELQDSRPQQAQEELQKLLKEAEDDLGSTNASSVSSTNTGTGRKALIVQLRRTMKEKKNCHKISFRFSSWRHSESLCLRHDTSCHSSLDFHTNVVRYLANGRKRLQSLEPSG